MFSPPGKWHSHPLLLLTFEAGSLLLHCGVNSKLLTTIKQKMKLEWHYLKIYLKSWPVSLKQYISFEHRKNKKLWLFLWQVSFSLKSKGKKILICPESLKQWLWIDKQGGQYKYRINSTCTWNLILCAIPVL